MTRAKFAATSEDGFGVRHEKFKKICVWFSETKMAYFIHARDGAGLVVLKRETEEAALKKAYELEEVGWLEVEVSIRRSRHPVEAVPAGR
jgi:hypothetical protein